MFHKWRYLNQISKKLSLCKTWNYRKLSKFIPFLKNLEYQKNKRFFKIFLNIVV